MTQPSPARFNADERALLLTLKGVGPTVLQRLEALDITSLDSLARQSAAEVCRRIALMVGTSCWSNSPMARSAIESAIEAARQEGSR